MLGLGKCGHPDGREGWEHAPGHCLGLSQLCFSRAQFRQIPGRLENNHLPRVCLQIMKIQSLTVEMA